MSSLIIGCGYLGRRVARRCRDEGDDVVAIVRSAGRAAELAGEEAHTSGLRILVADVTRPETLDVVPAAERVLFCVGYAGNDGRTRREVHVEGLANVLDRLDPQRSRLVFVSTTGVVGDAGGAWVDDASPCRPTRTVGRVFLEAEATLRRHPCGDRAVILRMAGIYGPGRLAREDALRQGRPLEVAAENYLNLIHVDDAAQVVAAAWRGAKAPETYLVADGQPVFRRDFYRHLARLLDAPEPRFVEPAAADAPQRHDGANKRVDGRRALAELNVQLQYPSYREGLAASVR